MPLGAVEWVLGPGDEAARWERARRLGLSGVEAALTAEDFRGLEARGRRLERARDATGVAVPSLMLHEHNRGGIASADPAVARRAREEVGLAVGLAAALGARVVLVPFFFAAELATEEDLARAAEGFAELAPRAEAAGVTLAYEGTLPAGGVRRLADMVGSPAFGCYADVANAVWLGMDSAVEIRALGDLVRQVHLKDTRVEPGDCRLGLGRVDLEAAAAALDAIGYEGWVVLETPAGPPELVARDAAVARRLFPQAGAAPPQRLGIFSHGFGRGQERRLLEVCRECGLGAVQLAGDLLAEALEDPGRAAAVRRTLEEGDVRVAALAGYRNLVAPDEGRRREGIAHLKRCLEAAPLLGTSVVATETGTRHPGGDWRWSPENRSAAAWAALGESLAELLETAERAGTILALEGYVNDVLRTPGQLLALLERFSSEHLQVVLDPYNYVSRHLLAAQERVLRDLLRWFEPRFVLAHAKDVGPEGAEAATPEFGTGVFPQAPYLAFLRERRPDLPLILEHLPLEHVPQAAHLVRGA